MVGIIGNVQVIAVIVVIPVVVVDDLLVEKPLCR